MRKHRGRRNFGQATAAIRAAAAGSGTVLENRSPRSAARFRSLLLPSGSESVLKGRLYKSPPLGEVSVRPLRGDINLKAFRGPWRKQPGTFLASARLYWCCSGSNDNCRRAKSFLRPRESDFGPFRRQPRHIRRHARRETRPASGRRHERPNSWAIRPRATIAQRSGRAAIVAARKGRQLLISDGIGLFCGGTQRTALVIAHETSRRPSSIDAP